MTDADQKLHELPGRPVLYYLQVVRRWWGHLLVGTTLGVLGGLVFLWASPPAVTATAVLELDIVTSDPFGLDRAPSSLLDVGTEQQVARSYLVAEKAAADLGGILSPAHVLASTNVSVRPQGTVMHIEFTAADAPTARAGADAVANRFLEARGQKVEDRINDQMVAIQERLDELEDEQAELTAQLTAGGRVSDLGDSRLQSIRNEVQALVQQRTLLNSVAIAGGRPLTSGAVGEITYSPSRSLVLAGGGAVGFLVGLVMIFLRQSRPHHVVDMAEVEAYSGAPVLREGGAGGLEAAVIAGMVPPGREKLLICNLGTPQDGERVVSAMNEAISRDPEATLELVVLENGLRGEDFLLSDMRHVQEAALIANKRTTSTSQLKEALEILDLLDVSVIATVWSSPPRAGRTLRKGGSRIRDTTPVKGAA